MKSYLYFVPMLTLAGCTDYSNAFDCPPKPGMGCKSISEISEEIIESRHDDDELIVTVEAPECNGEKCAKSKPSDLGAFFPRSQGAYLVSSGNTSVHRVPERIIRIWVNGRVNDTGDYVAPHYIFVALKDDGWLRLKQQEMVHDDT